MTGGSAFVVRPGRESDVPEMLRLWRDMMDYHAQEDPRFRPKPSPEGEQAWEQFLRQAVWANNEYRMFVAVAGDQLIGHVIGALKEPYPVFEPIRYGEVMDIVVDPAARRQGVGQALFAALKVWFRERGAEHLQLHVAHRNAVSQAFWRALGCTDYMDTLWYNLEAE